MALGSNLRLGGSSTIVVSSFFFLFGSGDDAELNNDWLEEEGRIHDDGREVATVVYGCSCVGIGIIVVAVKECVA